MSAMRTCKGCGEDFPCTEEYFEWDGKGHLRHRCRSCRKAYWNAYHRAQRDAGIRRARPYAAAFNTRRREEYRRDPETRRSQNRTWYARKRYERADIVIGLILERATIPRSSLLRIAKTWSPEMALIGRLPRLRSVLIYMLRRQHILHVVEIAELMGTNPWVVQETSRRVSRAIRCHAGRGRKKTYGDPDLRDMIENILDELWDRTHPPKEKTVA